MIAFLNKHPKVGAITPKIWLDEGKTLQSHILHPVTIRQFIMGFTPLGKLFPSNWVFKKCGIKILMSGVQKTPLKSTALPAHASW